jgi:hypothetical protein
LPDQWKESIIVSVHKKGDKTDCRNYCGISRCIKTAQYMETRKVYIIFNTVHKGVTISGSYENNIKIYIRIICFVQINEPL